ncbi:MAG: four-carbon acid sugar kinase family protein [Oscillospiraceae bacterium]
MKNAQSERYTEEQKKEIWRELADVNARREELIVVLDDDPTGIQTVHDINVYTDWQVQTLVDAFKEEKNMFFILTNSRGMTAKQVKKQYEEIAENIIFARRSTGRCFLLICRGDSTLRGHYPLEGETLCKALENKDKVTFDGEIIIPFFGEGGRYTLGDIHYLKQEDKLVPVGETEFAKDKTFGYASSNLRAWCQEKTEGRYSANRIVSVGLEELQKRDYAAIENKLRRVQGFNKVVVNAACYEDLAVFTTALIKVLATGKHFLYRTSASFVKVLGGILDVPLLQRKDMIDEKNEHGGVVIIGSHVNKTTRQLEKLKQSDMPLCFLEFDQHKILEQDGLKKEAERVLALVEEKIKEGQTCVVYSRRERFDLPDSDKEKQLEAAVCISDAITSIVGDLKVRPSFIVAKGGITSSDIGTKALRVKKARVLGQAAAGVPVWQTGEESKFSGLPYVIFPGNVGDDETLYEVVKKLI